MLTTSQNEENPKKKQSTTDTAKNQMPESKSQFSEEEKKTSSNINAYKQRYRQLVTPPYLITAPYLLIESNYEENAADILKNSPDQQQIRKGLATLRKHKLSNTNLFTTENQAVILLAGENAPHVADALDDLDDAGIDLTDEIRFAVALAGSLATNVAKSLITFNKEATSEHSIEFIKALQFLYDLEVNLTEHVLIAFTQHPHPEEMTLALTSLKPEKIPLTEQTIELVIQNFLDDALVTPIAKNPILNISESLFGHICAEGYLAGAFRLEGSSFTETADFLEDYMRTCQDMPPAGKKICTALRDLARYTQRIRDANSDEAWATILSEIYIKFKILTPDKFILIPGGWYGSPGHSMIYELRKSDNGSLIFNIYNSGDGIDQHETHLDEYNPVMHYEAPPDELKKSDFQIQFKVVIKQLLRTRTEKNTVKTGIGLYNEVIAKLAYLGAQLQGRSNTPSDKEREKFTRGQLSGVCAESVLHEMLKFQFPNESSYKQFLYRFKAHALQCYLRTLIAQHEIHNSEKVKLLEKGIKSNLRLLNCLTNDGEYLFDDSFKTRELGYLSEYLKVCNAVQTKKWITPTYREAATKIHPHEKVSFKKVDYLEQPRIAIDDKEEKNSLINLTPVTKTRITDSNPEQFLANLQAILEELNRLYISGQYEEAIQRLEDLVFVQLKLPENRIDDPLEGSYSNLNTNQNARLFFTQIKKINQLADELSKSYKKMLLLSESSIAEDTFTAQINLHCMVLIAHVFSWLPAYREQPNDYNKLLQKMLDCFPDKERMLNAFNLASYNPMIDARYEQLCHLVHSSKDNADKRIDDTYYPGGYAPRTNKEIQEDEQLVLNILKNRIMKSPSLSRIAECLYLRAEKKETEDAKDNDAARKKCIAMHAYLKKQQLDTVYGFLKFIEQLNQDFQEELSDEWNVIIDQLGLNTTDKSNLKEEINRFHQDVLSIQQGKNSFLDSNETLWPFTYNATTNTLEQENSYSIYSNKRVAVFSMQNINIQHLHSSIAEDLRGNIQGQPYRLGPPIIDAYNIDSRIMLERKTRSKRELLLLRLVRETQVQLTLDYFSINLDLLSDKEMRSYMQANLFQPGILKKQLEINADEFILKFDQFIEYGYQFYNKKNQLTTESLFFVRLSFLLFQYAAQLDSSHHLERLELFYKKLSTESEECQNNSIKRTLLKYRMLCGYEIKMLTSDHKFDFSADDIETCFALSLWQDKEDPLDDESQYQLIRTKKCVLNSLREMESKSASAALSTFFKKIGYNLDAYEMVYSSYPYYIYKSNNETLKIDLKNAIFYKNNMAYSEAPDTLKKHPIFKKFNFGSVTHCFLNSGSDKTWIVKNDSIEIQISDQRCYIRGIKGLATDKWYEIFAADDSQAKYFGIQCNKSINLSPTVLDFEHFLLISLDEKNVFDVALVKNSKVMMKGKMENGNGYLEEYENLEERTTKRTLCENESSATSEIFSSFEAEKYINVFYIADENKYDIELPRYGLTFSKVGNEQPHCYYNGERYNLKSMTHVLIEEDIPELVLINDNDDQIALFPRNQFLLTGRRSRNEAYKHFKLDINDTVDNHLSSELEIKRLEESKSEHTLSWQQKDSKKHYTIKMKNGEPTPENSEQALYLAYLYLGAHQPDKAWQMLTLCDKDFGGIAGSFTELEYLQWIIESLPFDMTWKRYKGDYYCSTRDKDELIEDTPEVLACKLKALSFITKLDKSATVVSTQNDTPRTHNEAILNFQKNQVQKFIARCGQHISSLYKRQIEFSSADELIAKFSLTENEKWALLDYCNVDNTLTSSTFLEYQKLYINILLQEIESLKHTTNSEGAIKAIESYIKSVKAVSFRQISMKQINLFFNEYYYFSKRKENDMLVMISQDGLETLKSKLVFNPQLVDDFFNTPSKEKADLIHDQAINCLTDEMTDEQAIQYFSFYVSIAEDRKNADFEKLFLFTQKVLLSHAKNSSKDAKRSLLPLLAYSIYLIAHFENSNFLYDVEKQFHHTCIHNTDRRKAIESSITLFATILKSKSDWIDPINLQSHVSQGDILVTADTMQSMLPKRNQEKIPIPLIGHSKKTDIASDSKLLDTNEKKQIEPFNVWFNKTHTLLNKELVASKTFATIINDEKTDPLSFFSSDEYKEGKKQLGILKQLRALSDSDLFSDDQNKLLLTSTEIYNNSLSTEISSLENQILNLAKSRFPITQLINIASDHSEQLDINKLLALYFKNDLHQYRKETALPDNEIEKLHHLLIQFVEYKTAQQQAKRCIKLLKSLVEPKKENSEDSKPTIKLQLAQAYLETNLLDAANDTVLSTFQLHSDLLKRQNKIATLENLLTQPDEKKNTETIEKIIMGGGKTKVILPTLAEKKANGRNLVIYEVPRALLGNCYPDLRSTSIKLFGQEALLFHFTRHSDSTPQALKHLHIQFVRAIQNKSYMVTTGESLQSLELKYFELLKKEPPAYPNNVYRDWCQSVHSLDQLLILLRERGALIIDEVHDGLLLKNKLNYTLNEPDHLSSEIAHTSIAFYRFLDHCTFTLSDGLASSNKKQLTFSTLLTAGDSLQPEQYDEFCVQLAENIFTDSRSPLQEIIKRNNITDSLEFKKYILDQSDQSDSENDSPPPLPSFITNIVPEDLEILAFYKAELSQFLALTLRKKHLVEYGESNDPSLPLEQRPIAIPFRSNNIPKYGSSFGHPIETINYTIQSMLLSGIDKESFIALLKDLDNSSKKQSSIFHISENETDFGVLFFNLTSENLSDLDLTSPDTIERLYTLLKKNKTLIYYALETAALRKIKLEKEILHADNYSHVDMVHSCNGITATPYNTSTYHTRLSYDSNSAIGTDGYVISAIEDKPLTLKGLDFTNTKNYLETIFSSTSNRTRALIDICATFKGIDNHAVAGELANYFANNQDEFSKNDKKIKYILYFNAEDKLTAIPASTSGKKAAPIIIGRSDPDTIREKLGCTPDELFTYYDQSHTLGADIKQSDDANAIVLVDKTTQLQQFLQGAMRMRGLIERDQSIEIVMPAEMKKSLGSDNTEPKEIFHHLIDFMHQSQNNQLKKDNFPACVANLNNAIRNDFCKRILAIDTYNAHAKAEYFQKVDSFFIERKKLQLYSQFGNLSCTGKTQKILENIRDDLMINWKTLLQLSETSQEYILMKDYLNEIIAKKGECEDKQLISSAKDNLIVETTKQQKDDKQKLEETQTHTHAHKRAENNESNSGKQSNNYISIHSQTKYQLHSLNSECKTSFFDECLTVSINFYESYYRQTSMLASHLKPVHGLYFTQKEGELHCQLITQHEYAELLKDFVSGEIKDGWISTTSHTKLIGNPPPDFMENKDYQRLVTQARYFNGEFYHIIQDKKIDHTWLKEQGDQKIKFFEDHLLSKREIPLAEMEIAKLIFSPRKDNQDAQMSTLAHTTEQQLFFSDLEQNEIAGEIKLERSDANNAFRLFSRNNRPVSNDATPSVIYHINSLSKGGSADGH